MNNFHTFENISMCTLLFYSKLDADGPFFPTDVRAKNGVLQFFELHIIYKSIRCGFQAATTHT